MARAFLPPPRPRARLDVSLAIVNIVLLLILFFLAAGTLVPGPGTGVVPARTEVLPPGALPRPLLSVAPDGTLRLDGAPVTAETLPGALGGVDVLHVAMDGAAPALELLDLLARPELAPLEIELVTVRARGAPE